MSCVGSPFSALSNIKISRFFKYGAFAKYNKPVISSGLLDKSNFLRLVSAVELMNDLICSSVMLHFVRLSS